MPVERRIDHIPGISAATWLIAESEQDLISICHLTDEDLLLYRSFRHPGRKKHWLACRALITELLYPVKPVITYNSHGKPSLSGIDLEITMSHAGDFAAVAISQQKVGIDIEKITPRVERVRDRFLSAEELASLKQPPGLDELWLGWCGKEALYKLNGSPDVDFRDDIRIHSIKYLCSGDMESKGTIVTGEETVTYNLWFNKDGGYMLAIAFEQTA